MARRADKAKAPNAEFGKRLRNARYDAQKTLDRKLSDQAIGKAVAALTGWSGAYTRGAVGKWFAGWEPESFAVVEALARLLFADPGRLAFGEPAVARSMTRDEVLDVLSSSHSPTKRKRRRA